MRLMGFYGSASQLDMYYMSYGLVFEMYYVLLRNFQNRCQMTVFYINCLENRLRVD